MSRLALSGQISNPVSRGPQGIFMTLVLLVVTVLAYGGWKMFASHHSEPTGSATTVAAPATTPAPLTDESVEDMQNHLRHVEEAIVRIQENTKRIDQRINQVSPSLQQNYLHLQQQRLNVADQLSQSVLRDSAQALEELELTQHNLQHTRR